MCIPKNDIQRFTRDQDIKVQQGTEIQERAETSNSLLDSLVPAVVARVFDMCQNLIREFENTYSSLLSLQYIFKNNQLTVFVFWVLVWSLLATEANTVSQM